MDQTGPKSRRRQEHWHLIRQRERESEKLRERKREIISYGLVL